MKLTWVLIKQLLDYDPKTGILTWLFREESLFKTSKACKTWNKRFAGKQAFAIRLDKNSKGKGSQGYLQGSIFGKMYQAHRVIFFWMTGRWPKLVDHDNQIKSDNRWENLIESNRSKNARNCSRSATNTSGVTGVVKRKNRFIAQIKNSDEHEYLGIFSTIEEASRIRKQAEEEHGFSRLHGKEKS